MMNLAMLAMQGRQIDEGVERIEAVMGRKPVPEPRNPRTPISACHRGSFFSLFVLIVSLRLVKPLICM